jgi:superfamily II DNA or RNA helicase
MGKLTDDKFSTYFLQLKSGYCNNTKMQEHGYITSEGFLVPDQLLKAKFGEGYAALIKKLTLTHYPKIGPPKSAKLYKYKDRDGTRYIYLPRTLSRVLGKIIPSVVALGNIVRIRDCPMQIELFENQQIVVAELMKIFSPDRIAAGTACAILNLRAGMGKTFVAAMLISMLKLRTLYITPKVPLAVQAVLDLKNCFYGDVDGGNQGNNGPNDNNAVGGNAVYGNAVGGNVMAGKNIIVGNYNKKPKKRDMTTDPGKQDVTVICIDSAILRDSDFFSKYSFIIFDEVHTYCSDVRRKIFKLAGSWVMLGMSATTEDRADGFDGIAHKELAYDGIIRAENLPGFNYEGVDFKSLVTVIRYNGPPEYTQTLISESTGRMFTPYMNKQFLRDPFRTSIALAELRALYDWRGPEGQCHCIYVFCEEVDPLEIIYRGFIDSFGEGNVVAPEIGKFTGGIKEQQIVNMRANARIFLTTYGYSGTGVSIDKMTAILFLTPRRANMKQILARILRRGGDQSIQRRVIDIVDNRTGMKYQLGSRKLAYEYYGMEIESKTIQAQHMQDE